MTDPAPAAEARDVDDRRFSALVQALHSGGPAQVEAPAAQILAQYPRAARVWQLLGAARLMAGRTHAAHEALQRAHELAPRDAATLNLLGVALSRQGRFGEARAAFEQSLVLAPDSYDTLVNAAANELEAKAAESGMRLAQRALALRPGGIEALTNLGNAAAALGRLREAEQHYRRAIALGARHPDVWMNLANAQTSLGRASEAVQSLQELVRLHPGHAAAQLNLGRAHYELGEIGPARDHFRAASDLAPWLDEAHSAYLFSLAHDETTTPERNFAEHLRIGDLIAAPFAGRVPAHDNDRDPGRALRIGFVSADLHDHPIANLIEPVWRALRGLPHRVIAYDNHPQHDAVSARLRGLTDGWIEIEQLDDAAADARIRADRIDVLFDLSGHTARNRLRLFARKPAPIQVSWFGYPGTTGLASMDYRFVRTQDAAAPDLQPYMRERLVYFRQRGFAFVEDAPPVNPLPALRAGQVSFASFNRASKIGAPVVEVWCRILREVADARLILAAAGEPRLQQRLLAQFAAQGIGAARLEFVPRLPMLEYLRLHHRVDIALDSFPYSGGTTTSHALWMGVPVIALDGPSLGQTQTAAVLRRIGLADWVGSDTDAYVRRACAAAADLDALAALRAGLRARMSDSAISRLDFVSAELDAALRTMWRRWCAGLPAETFAVTP